MDCVVMAGGRGTRLGSHLEKPLVPVAGRPMVDRVLAALRASAVDRVVVATTAATPATRAHVDAPTVTTPGEGYVADLDAAVERAGLDRPLVTVAADLPLLGADAIDRALAAHDGDSLTVAVPAALKRDLGVSVDTAFDGLAPTGLNVVGAGEGDTDVRADERLAVNVNGPRDLAVARRFAWSDGSPGGQSAGRDRDGRP